MLATEGWWVSVSLLSYRKRHFTDHSGRTEVKIKY